MVHLLAENLLFDRFKMNMVSESVSDDLAVDVATVKEGSAKWPGCEVCAKQNAMNRCVALFLSPESRRRAMAIIVTNRVVRRWVGEHAQERTNHRHQSSQPLSWCSCALSVQLPLNVRIALAET